jgi:cystathionine beta-lyase
MFDFDEEIDRKNTMCIKYDYAKKRGKPENAYPMWVADMEFKSPPCVKEALAERLEHGIYGYSDADESYNKTLENWFLRRFNWEINSDWNTITQGVVPAIFIAVRAFTAPGDRVLIQTPVYYPFFEAVKSQKRELIENQLILKNGKYEIDFVDFENKIKSCKLFILCSPHNPVGRVWTADELRKMGEIAKKYGVIIIADEIHSDFVYSGNSHTVFANFLDFSDNVVTCTSPSKTFNLAGLLHANIIIKNKILREKFRREYALAGLSQGSVMGLVACKAVYEKGDIWLEELLKYLEKNIEVCKEIFKNSDIDFIVPEGTYLLWFDCRKLKLTDSELDRKILEKAKLWLDRGTMFGENGSGFTRLNMALARRKFSLCLQRLISVAEIN